MLKTIPKLKKWHSGTCWKFTEGKNQTSNSTHLLIGPFGADQLRLNQSCCFFQNIYLQLHMHWMSALDSKNVLTRNVHGWFFAHMFQSGGVRASIWGILHWLGRSRLHIEQATVWLLFHKNHHLMRKFNVLYGIFVIIDKFNKLVFWSITAQ